MKGDFETFNSRVQYSQDGSKSNPLKLKDIDSADIKTLAAKLTQIDENTNTHGEYFSIGELYGFKLLVKTEQSGGTTIDGIFRNTHQNRFFIEGEGNVKYTHNNGLIAKDPKLAVNYFINALDKIPAIIEKYERKNRDLAVDIPVLEEISKSTWRKENELNELKTELAAVDRKIQLSLAPVDISEDLQKNETRLPENVTKRLNEYKDVMGDRLVIASLPTIGEEKISGRKM